MGWWDIPSAEETEIPKVPLQDHVDNFFDSQGVVHKELAPEGKTVNVERYMSSSRVFNSIFNKISPKTFGPHCVRYLRCVDLRKKLPNTKH